MINSGVAIWARNGFQLTGMTTESLGSFFSTVGVDRRADQMSDPRVVYDSATTRWYTIGFDITRNQTILGVSDGGDPNAGWLFYTFRSDGCPDQPRLAVTDQLVVITDNLYSSCDFGTFIGGEVAVLSKSAVITGQSLNASTAGFFGPDRRYFAITPAQPLTTLAGSYMVAVDSGAATAASLLTVNSPADASIPVRRVPIPLLASPPDATQPGGAVQLDTGDNRVQSAVFDNGVLWFSASDECAVTGQAGFWACGRVAGIAVGSATITSESVLALAGGKHAMYPTLSVDRSGNVLTVFGYASSVDAPGIGVVMKPASQPLSNWAPITAGAAAYTSVSSGRNRWGDYFAAVRDSLYPDTVWVAAQFASGPSSWGTTIAAVGAATAALAPTITHTVPSALNVSASGATFTGYVNPQGLAASYHFEYGPTSSYGFSTPTQSLSSSSAATYVSATVQGLASGVTYHFRLVASSDAGQSAGPDQILTTLTPVVRDTQPPVVSAVSSSARAGGIARLAYRLWEETGETREVVRIRRGGTQLARLATTLSPIANGSLYYTAWKVPAGTRGSLRFCVTALDRAGNQSAESCASLMVR
jgi:hypothetical protein